MNNDCDKSTYCCSQGLCVPGTICFQGHKQPDDYCDFGFECLSRCCSNLLCTNVLSCVDTCAINRECLNTECCSFGFCSESSSLCDDGLKVDFDVCDKSSECKSGSCVNARCKTSSLETKSGALWIGLCILIALIVFITAFSCCFVKIR